MIGSLHSGGRARPGLRRPLVGALAAVLLLAAQASAAPGWSGPRTLGNSADCSEVSATIDAAGTNYVAADCDEYVRVSHNKGLAWTTVQFGHPADRVDEAPQVAIDGSRLYVAFSGIAVSTDTGCGYDYVGVYIRWRNVPTGAWSQPTRIGNIGDRLQSFRVVDGVIHATVVNGESVIYETTASGAMKRYPLTDAVGASSLRVGSDGMARMVYEGASALRYAVFLGSSFEKSSIPGTRGNDRRPQLVLDGDNKAHVVWTHAGPLGPTVGHTGCGFWDAEPEDGTYYATNRSGTWSASAAAGQRRVTLNYGQASLTLDISTGRPHVLVGGDFGVKYYTPGTGKWNGLTLSTNDEITGVAIRIDQTSKRLFVVYARYLGYLAEDGPNLSYLTKP